MSWIATITEHGELRLNPGIRFATRGEAEAYGADLQRRFGGSGHTAKESDGSTTYSFDGGVLNMLMPAFPHPYS